MGKKNFQDIQRAFSAHIRNPDKHPVPEDIESRRAKIYSDLFYNNVNNFVSRAFPVIKKIFGEQRWNSLVRDFYEKHACQTPYFNEIAQEFIDYLENERESKDDPPFLLELAHYEWTELDLEISTLEIPATGFNPNGNLLKGQIVLSPLARVLHYHWPVHQISPDFQPEQKNEHFFLIVYRNPENRVRFIETNAISARLLGIIQENSEFTGTQAIAQLSDELEQQGQSLDIATLLKHGEEILEDFKNKSVVLGSRIEAIK